jgi:hypothetical protein
VIPTFKQNVDWRQNFTELLYPESGGHTLFNEEIHEPLQDYLKNHPVVLTANEEFAKPEKCVTVDEGIRTLLSDSDFEELFQDYARVYDTCTVPWKLEQQMVSGPNYSSTKGLKNGMQDLLELKASQEDSTFFTEFYKEIGNWSQSTLSGTKMQREPIVMTVEGDLCTPKDAYIRTDVDIPPQLEDEFRFVYPDISADEALSVLKTLGAKEVTQDDIDERVDIEQTLDLDEWSQLSEADQIRRTRKTLQLYNERNVSPDDLSSINVLTSDGEWRVPSTVVFSDVYNPPHNLEALDREGLIPTSITFLSSEYISATDKYSTREWREFFEAVGVEEKLNESSLVEQIGIESALRIETEQGRDAEALSRHEEKEGYDIKSDNRLIEVKGSKKSSPSVNLTQQQFSRLKDDPDQYYLYIVRNALERPEVAVIQGKNILDVNRSIRVSYSKLQGLSESEHTIV